MDKSKNSSSAYIVAADMGYGHQRALYPFLDIAAVPKEWNLEKPIIITANNYPTIPSEDRKAWELMQKGYEFVSRLNGFPVLGKRIFRAMDYFQRILPFYPKRDLSRPSLQLKNFYRMIGKGLGKHLIETLNKNPLPFLTSFFVAAFFAEEHGYKGPIYCLCTDSDVSRAWAPLNPQKSNITYLAPNKRVKDRLMMYGVIPEKIIVTGFPLPQELIGDRETMDVLKKNLSCRIKKLDPKGIYQEKYEKVIHSYLGVQETDCEVKPISITFAIGGAGAQTEIGVAVLHSLAEHIRKGVLKLTLVAGTSRKVLEKFQYHIRNEGLEEYLGKNIHILFHTDKMAYFEEFNKLLATTDILWTKPSELSFYTGLGLPILMCPPLGSQEEFNRSWIHSLGSGIGQRDPEYASEWLFEWIESGWFAKAAMSGFLDAPKKGTYHIEDLILRGEKTEIRNIHLI